MTAKIGSVQNRSAVPNPSIGFKAEVIAVGIIWTLIDDNSSSKNQNKQPTKPKTQAELHQEKIKSRFSAWDGSHHNLEKFIKKAMKDEDSYEHVKTVYWENDSYLIVKTTFKGKNAFGGVVKNWVKAKVDLNGNIIEVIEQGP